MLWLEMSGFDGVTPLLATSEFTHFPAHPQVESNDERQPMSYTVSLITANSFLRLQHWYLFSFPSFFLF